MYVKTIVSGGSAERDKTIHVGDSICRVDDRDCLHEPLPVLRKSVFLKMLHFFLSTFFFPSMILGPQGTFVKLTFARVSGNETIQVHFLSFCFIFIYWGTFSKKHYEVRLMRGTAEYFSALDASFRRQGELDALRGQLREALANGAQVCLVVNSS